MITIFRFVAAAFVMGIITCPLFMESWFTLPIWIVICLYSGVRYVLYMTTQENNVTLTKSILMRLDRNIENDGNTGDRQKTKKAPV